MVPDHLRRDRRLVDEHEARRIETRLLGLQPGARSGYVRTILLGGVQSFFEGDVVTLVEAPDRANTGFVLLHSAQPCTNLLKCQVRLRGDQIEQPLPVLLKLRAAMAGAR